MQLDFKKCEEMLIDVPRRKAAIPYIKVEDMEHEYKSYFQKNC